MVEAVEGLDPERRAEFERLWQDARFGDEQRLCADAADTEQGLAPPCIDWAALSGIAGDHACSSAQMLGTVRSAEWILVVADIAAQLKADLAAIPDTEPLPQPAGVPVDLGVATRRLADEANRARLLNALRTADTRLQRADALYATRADSNNAHFMLARPDTSLDPYLHGERAIKAGAEVNARRDRLWLAGTLLATPLLHVAMDATNNYGVHPFWPIYNGWLYGDSVFIIEPLMWAACAPLAFLLRTRAARVVVVIVLVLGLWLSYFSGLVAIPAALALTLLVIAMITLTHRARPQVAAISGVALWMLVTATFLGAARAAGERADALAATLFPGARLLDRVTTPMPANPLCWEIMLIQSERAQTVLRRGMLTLAPHWIPADRCLSGNLDMPATAPLQPVRIADTAELRWYGEVATPTAVLAHAYETSCEAAAALLFIRAPWIASVGQTTVLGDLRYDREPSLGFAEIALHSGAGHCPRWLPPWRPPRADLLYSAASYE